MALNIKDYVPAFKYGAQIDASGDIIVDASITRTDESAAAGSINDRVTSATIATTGNTEAYTIVGQNGTITSIDFSGVDALAASDTNYITWTIVNIGQAGAGSTNILASSNANTTKATGGSAIAANTKRSLVLTSVASDLNVTAGDRIGIRVTATGTLANTVTFPVYMIRYSGTT